MQRRYVTTDVFTDRAFGGNPLAVVLDATGLTTAQMQSLAREFNYSETTFVLPPADPAHAAQVRIFTPSEELPFAGHPNVGTAVVLARRLAQPCPTRLVFEEAAGLVALTLDVRDGEPVGAELTAPTPFARGATVDAERLAVSLGLDRASVATGRHPPVQASCGLPFLIAELASRDALRRARPHGETLPALLTEARASGVFVYTHDAAGQGCDLQSRMFFPLDSFVEDPATGSANVALAGLLASCAAEADLDASWQVGQGFDMGRPSLLRIGASKRGGRVVATRVGGRCVEMMQGTLTLAGAA